MGPKTEPWRTSNKLGFKDDVPSIFPTINHVIYNQMV